MKSDVSIEAFDFETTFDIDDKRIEFTAKSEAELDIPQNLLYERRVLNELVESLRPDDVACPWCRFELGEGEKLRGGAEFANQHNTL